MTNESTSESKETDVRVGYAITSVLESMCLEYIQANTVNGKFEGDVHYLIAYDNLKRYNENEN
jgi:hypothetical protein